MMQVEGVVDACLLFGATNGFHDRLVEVPEQKRVDQDQGEVEENGAVPADVSQNVDQALEVNDDHVDILVDTQSNLEDIFA